MSLYTDPPVGIFAVGDEVNLKIVHALIVGPEGTPYDGGFFYFILKFPNNYPIQPPKVKLMTTDAGQVRFNPNFYNSGKVCVSILGTWVGPPWSPAQQLSSILVTIQSLMTENPFYNEPGFECVCMSLLFILLSCTSYKANTDYIFILQRSAGEAKVYRNYVQYHTLRAAICGMVENETCLAIPIQLKTIMEKLFLSSFDLYIETAEKYSCLNGSLTTVSF